MRRQILSRAFYGWLAYHRHLRTVRVHLVDLVNSHDKNDDDGRKSCADGKKLDEQTWNNWLCDLKEHEKQFYQVVYWNGIEASLRKKVWPFLLGHYEFGMSEKEREEKDKRTVEEYARSMSEWRPFEEFVHLREAKKAVKRQVVDNSDADSGFLSTDVSGTTPDSITSLERNFPKKIPISTPIINSTQSKKNTTNKTGLLKFNLLRQMNGKSDESEESMKCAESGMLRKDSSLSNEVFMEENSLSLFSRFSAKNLLNKIMLKNTDSTEKTTEEEIESKLEETKKEEPKKEEPKKEETGLEEEDEEMAREIAKNFVAKVIAEAQKRLSEAERKKEEENELAAERFAPCLADKELVDNFALNIHRIDKDVTRCDRNFWYFVSNENLVKLKNIMYT